MMLQAKSEIIKQAKAKLAEARVTEHREKLIEPAVRLALESFCEQEVEFARAILDKDAGFESCLRHVTQGVGSCLSDEEAYRRAVEFYFPGAGVHITMTINLCASVDGSGDTGITSDILQPAEKTNGKEETKRAVLNLSLDDLF